MTGAVTRLTVGREAQPVIVLDDVIADPVGLRAAAARVGFGPAHHLYPGIRADLPPGYLREIIPIVAATAAAHFGGGALETIDASFSMVTTPPADLSIPQRLPHCDAFDARRIAMVHFLNDTGGGTAFYRHRSTGFETVDDDRRPIFFDQLEAELRHGGLPAPRYLDGDSAQFERIALVEPRANRAVLYRSFLLHSGAIPADVPLAADPATGRLTVTGFFRLTA